MPPSSTGAGGVGASCVSFFERGAAAVADRDAFVAQLAAALPEARAIQRAADDHTARVITFELLTEER
jgi:hypothetical protein